MFHFKIKGDHAFEFEAVEKGIKLLHDTARKLDDDHGDGDNAYLTVQLDNLGIELVTSYDSGVGEGGSEVVSYYDGKLYVTNG